jgi:DNA polymerase elongation subunit (family B)
LSKQIAEDEFGMRVIYGDTDSIMMVKDDLSRQYHRQATKPDIRVREGATPDHHAARNAVESSLDSWTLLKRQQLTPEQRALVYAAGDDALAELMRQAELVAARVTDAIGRPPMSLEFEALFDNYRQWMKKRCVKPSPPETRAR